MAKPFIRLRSLLMEREITQTTLARELLLSNTWVSHKMCGGAPWTLEEMYVLMDLLDWPYEQMHELFPRNGGIKTPAASGRAGKLQKKRSART